jgi:hypothetical protein
MDRHGSMPWLREGSEYLRKPSISAFASRSANTISISRQSTNCRALLRISHQSHAIHSRGDHIAILPWRKRFHSCIKDR